MEPDALGWDPVLKSWLADTPPVMNSWLRNFLHESLFRRFCDPILYWSHHEHVQVFIFCHSFTTPVYLYLLLLLFERASTFRCYRKFARCRIQISCVQ